MDSKATIQKLCEEAGQSHLLRFVDELTEQERDELFNQLLGLDLQFCVDVHNRSVQQTEEAANLSPFPRVESVRTAAKDTLDQWNSVGIRAIADGEVAFITLAGGQGTRLGSPDPKGMYDIGLPSRKPLFQLQAERLLRLQTLALEKYGKAGRIQWYVMSSPATHIATETFFKAMNFFGLEPSQVMIFQQGTFPCFDFNSKIMLETKHSVNVSPDGNGGIYRAMHRAGVLEDMGIKGVEHAYVCSVDNALVRVCDPVFVGYCIAHKADVGAKVLPKAYAEEKVGVVCLRNNRPAVVEYSEMTPEETARVDPATGQLVFNTGNICVHYFSKTFLDRAHKIELPFHVAIKKIPYLDDKGEIVTPTSNTGKKMEQFIFDVFPFADNMAVLEGDRSEDFAPVKNAPGSSTDSPDTARAMVSDLHKKWASAVGATFGPATADGLFEISPLVSYAGEGLEGKFQSEITLPTHIE